MEDKIMTEIFCNKNVKMSKQKKSYGSTGAGFATKSMQKARSTQAKIGLTNKTALTKCETLIISIFTKKKIGRFTSCNV